MTPQPIQFLLHQLATNEGDRERFAKLFMPKLSRFNREVRKSDIEEIIVNWESGNVFSFLYMEALIRTCLSRVNGSDGDSVLGVFKSYHTQLSCYVVFDFELRNGKPLDTAIQALHDKMLELVPEYREFINNEK
jgi:hypothetical protein